MFKSEIIHLVVYIDPQVRNWVLKISLMSLSRWTDQFGPEVGRNRSSEEGFLGDGSSTDEIRPRGWAKLCHLAESARADFQLCPSGWSKRRVLIGPSLDQFWGYYIRFSQPYYDQRGTESREKGKTKPNSTSLPNPIHRVCSDNNQVPRRAPRVSWIM